MEITSSAFLDNTLIPRKYTCEGDNVSLPLSFHGIPDGTKSLALLMTDPDASSGDFVHWIMWNIDPKNKTFNEGEVPKGAIEGQNDFGTYGYKGPCPPSGMHRYIFHAYAVDRYLNLPQTSNKTDLFSHLGGSILEETTLTGLYTQEH